MQVDIYSKENCSYCDMAKKLLDNKSIPFNEYKIGKDLSRDRFFEIFPFAKTVPQILFDGVVIGGYTELVNRLNEKK